MSATDPDLPDHLAQLAREIDRVLHGTPRRRKEDTDRLPPLPVEQLRKPEDTDKK